MKRWAALGLGLCFAVAAGNPAQASLIGTTVQVSNDVYPEATSAFVVGDGPELFVCYYYSGPTCLLSYTLDIGADHIEQISINDTPDSYPIVENTNTYTFASNLTLVGYDEVINTWPVTWSYVVNPHSLVQTSPLKIWAANTYYDNYVQLYFVPEPGTLPLLGAGVVALALARRRFSA